MEIWWNSREDFERSQKIIAAPDRLDAVKEDEDRLFASHANPVCSVIEYDSPMGPAGEATRIELKYGNSSEERRVGKECVSTCRSRWSPDDSKKTKKNIQ